ncbi:hypothetical protein IFM89_010722 [Coptis chinensis]|uniref:AAA+ ATPase At3g28540-like C-terminal domain-containing protein n=1 Tax=Coptis chinensis TaxID=261450 RepID=A0A835IPQ8_9MAGN|nr:hypothetical protein IFM89_010722 [Coptis chinensis]
MANYRNFNIYDLELANLYSNSELQRLLVATANRSIVVIEDIDCSVELQDRTATAGTSEGRESHIQDDILFEEIELLIRDVNVTPAEVAEELMKSDDPKSSLEGLTNFLQRKKAENDKSIVQGEKHGAGLECQQNENDNDKEAKNNTTRSTSTKETKVISNED